MIAAPLAIGASLFQGVMAIGQGNAAAKQARNEGIAQQQELAINAQNTKIAAEQMEASRMEDLGRTIGTIHANIASRGLDLNSPSAVALENAASSYTARDIQRERFNAYQTSANDILAGNTAMTVASAKASAAKVAGYTSAAGSLFKATSYANSAGYFGTSGAASSGPEFGWS